ncbi:MAG: hypothetical protein HYX79_04095 [Chloroflexi bacterium]|nr:hypothetical protein [Chloroflexota bacterium]
MSKWILSGALIALVSSLAAAPASSNTLIIRINENEPVKQIIIFEAQVNPGAAEPLLEINGHDAGGAGKLRIGELKFSKVDAKRLEILETDVVNLTMTNVVAQDNELNVNVNDVAVVEVSGGAASTLVIGARIEDITSLSNLEDTNLVPAQQTGVRVDRIRILGPSSGFGSIERIFIVRSSISGKIEVRNAEIRDLILKDISLAEP